MALTNKAISAGPGYPHVAEKIIVLDSHAFKDNRISKHIGSVSVYYPVLRLNFNFYADRKASSPDISAQVFNVGNFSNPYLNGMMFTLRNMFGYSRRIEELLRKDFVKDDDRLIFHVHDPYVLGLAHKLKRKFPNSHIVYDRHEYYDAWRNRLGVSSPGLLERIHNKCVDEVVIVSRDYRGVVKNMEGKPVTVVPNYPEVHKFSEEPVKEKIAKFERTGKVTAVYFGVLNLDFDRDIRLMFQLADRLMKEADVEFIVGGRIDHEDVRPMLAHLEESHPERMKYLGELPYSEVVRKTQQAHLGFLLLDPNNPMFSEDMPNSSNKVYEYLLSGTVPIIRAVIDDHDEVGKCSLLFGKEASVEEMLDAILKFCRDQEKLKDRMVSCYKTGRQYSWDNVAKNYLECYRRLFSGK